MIKAALTEMVRRGRCPDLFTNTLGSRLMFESALKDAEHALAAPLPIGVDVTNETRHVLVAMAVALNETSIHVRLKTPPGHVDPLQKELEETKKVLGDLLQENLAGVKVYILIIGETLRDRAFCTPELAMKEAEVYDSRMMFSTSSTPLPPRQLEWVKTESKSNLLCWQAGTRYQVTEHVIG